MLNVFLALTAIAAAGASLHYFLPDLDIDAMRRQSGALVLNLLLPALNIEVIYHSPAGRELWQVPLAMLVGVFVCVGLGLIVLQRSHLDPRLKSSLLLACAFGNVTYLGMPLLRGLFPAHLIEVTELAILCEITVTSSDLIAGSLLAMYYHEGPRTHLTDAFVQVLKFPLIWSTAFAAIVRWSGIGLPDFLLMALHLLGQATSGLMLLVLGMALKPSVIAQTPRHIKSWWPAIFIKLGISPIVVALIASTIGLAGLNFRATTLEAAMPPQMFTFIVADRFGFDTEVLATAVAFMTVLSLVTVPIIHRMLG